MTTSKPTDFAELKEKLCYFDSQKNYNEILTETLIKNTNRDSKDLVVIMYSGARNAGRNEQHTKSAAIISELIEIIKLQSEALEYYKDGNGIDADFDENNGMVYYLEKTKDGLLEGFGFRSRKSLSETTTRLQKLRGGKNGNTTN